MSIQILFLHPHHVATENDAALRRRINRSNREFWQRITTLSVTQATAELMEENARMFDPTTGWIDLRALTERTKIKGGIGETYATATKEHLVVEHITASGRGYTSQITWGQLPPEGWITQEEQIEYLLDEIHFHRCRMFHENMEFPTIYTDLWISEDATCYTTAKQDWPPYQAKFLANVNRAKTEALSLARSGAWDAVTEILSELRYAARRPGLTGDPIFFSALHNARLWSG